MRCGRFACRWKCRGLCDLLVSVCRPRSPQVHLERSFSPSAPSCENFPAVSQRPRSGFFRQNINRDTSLVPMRSSKMFEKSLSSLCGEETYFATAVSEVEVFGKFRAGNALSRRMNEIGSKHPHNSFIIRCTVTVLRKRMRHVTLTDQHQSVVVSFRNYTSVPCFLKHYN